MPKILQVSKQQAAHRQPKREPIPVTPGREPEWDLAEVDTNYLVAELCRRGYRWDPKLKSLRGPAAA